MTIVRSVVLLALLSALLLLCPASTAAAGPDDYLVEMPDMATVDAAFVGTDDADSAALRFDAFLRLENMVKHISLLRGDGSPFTEAENALAVLYDTQTNIIRDDLNRSLPVIERGYYIGTGYAAWVQRADAYQADPAFNVRFRALFSPQFLTIYAPIFAKEELLDAAPLAPPIATPPPILPQHDLPSRSESTANPDQYLPILAWLGLYLVLYVLIGVLRPKRRPKEAK
jgi:hypothetical protein